MSSCPAFDPFSADVLEDPFTAYAETRGACPVPHVENHEPGFFVALRYADVVRIVTDQSEWTAKYGIGPRFQRGVGFNTDGPEHMKFRRAVMAGLGVKQVKALEPVIKELADDLLTRMEAHGPGDFHELFAGPLPVLVAARLLGIEGDVGRFKDLSDALMAEGMNSNDPAEFLRILEELDAYWEGQLAPRKEALAKVENPGPEHLGDVVPDDLMSMLLVIRGEDGRQLTDYEVSNSLMNLLLAGNETTISLLTNVVWRLLEKPERWAAVVADRDLVDVAIEESLRFDPPVLGMFRTSVQQTELSGTEIPEKTRVMATYGSANRDPEMFSEPDEFRLGRPRDELRRHIAFGKGAHACPGAALSRLEARIALNALLDKFEGLRLDGESERIEPFNFWGRKTLPVTW